MIKVGVIGCGRIAQVRHLPEYAEHPDARICGVYDRNPNRTASIAIQYGAKAYDSVEKILTDPEIEAVSICTANATHAPIAIAALRAGKHVLCEKPMATTLEECDSMIAAARESGKFLMIGHNQRLAKAHLKAKELLDGGEIGRIITVRTTFGHGGPENWSINAGKDTWFFEKGAAHMGVMADLGVHKTDLLHFLCGSPVKRVTARLVTLDKCRSDGLPIGVDDNAFCIYELKNGIVATMTASWTYYGAEDNSTVLYGTEGIMRIYDDPEHSIVVVRKNGKHVEYDIESIQTNDNQTKSGVIDLWMDCLINQHPPEISGESVLHSMRAVFAALESSETGRTVDIMYEE